MSTRFHPGEETFHPSDSHTSSFSAVFEDDGETGYFYAYDRKLAEAGVQPILDACHIYNVANVTDRHLESEIEIIWTGDGMKAALLINDQPHAVLDFAAKRGYCRSNFPHPGNAEWFSTSPGAVLTGGREPWDDSVLEDFYEH